jgi:hypothetical protein
MTWWCCRRGALVGDILVIYETGVGVRRILEVIGALADESGWCGYFGMDRAEVRVLQVAPHAISFAKMKTNPVLARTGAVKRSFQGKLFPLKEEELAEIERLLERAP